MELDPSSIDQREVYKLLIGCVVPRPIAWVSTIDAQGVRNLAPFSFFNAIGSDPPALMISINGAAARPEGRKDTLRNIVEIGEFVVNIVTEATAVAMNETATDYPPGQDEFALAGLTPAPSRTIRPSRVAESPVNFECVTHTLVPVGNNTVVIGTIKHIHINDTLLNERHHVDIHKLQPVARLAGNSYAYVHEVFELVRKSYTPPSKI